MSIVHQFITSAIKHLFQETCQENFNSAQYCTNHNKYMYTGITITVQVIKQRNHLKLCYQKVTSRLIYKLFSLRFQVSICNRMNSWQRKLTNIKNNSHLQAFKTIFFSRLYWTWKSNPTQVTSMCFQHLFLLAIIHCYYKMHAWNLPFFLNS